MNPTLGIWTLGLGLSACVLAVHFIGNLYAALALCAAGLLAAWRIAAAVQAPLERLRAGLEKLHANPRDFLLDEVDSWKALGPLGELASRVVRHNMERRIYYRGAVDAVGAPFLMAGADGRITHASQSLLDFLGRPAADVLGKSVGQAVYGKDTGSLTEQVLRSCSKVSDERAITLWNGRQHEVHVYIDCIRQKQGEALGVVMSLVDLTEANARKRQVEEAGERMLAVASEVDQLAQRMAAAAEELSATADEQARGAVKQKQESETVATAMEEMTATVLEVAKNAAKASTGAEQADHAAEAGTARVREAVEGIHQVAGSTARLGQVLQALDGRAAEIGRIIGVINDIADQTNLLALNAAIEAARAGEAGRGFAVVADEVRKLAEKTMVATREVESSILEIQNGSRNAVASMRETEEQVGASTVSTQQAGTALEEIRGRIRDMVSEVTQIATAAEEQSAAAEEINRSIEDIAQLSAQAQDGSAQTAQATRDLAGLSQDLLGLSGQLAGGGGAVGSLPGSASPRTALPRR
ncbi:Methyl-accepting chemotaxis protein McpQ [Fundidesulfovibrio magnetotacticus]|uniref:Methyl-accepting chemotaxis protein McpQ n=1 Tax=Fundidesulfovibrio magnetotacticus TaxID=2730080 RepID=A0A6V8LWL8_9BACT|nr:methyl-accepting chemotaxis protein [Fundidesulfovibrio magnetotacticus]GFK94668.1 Methyl-accepting chemotaxis protein McpQ [Fundidesulfovibrio magnetotacticus]